MASLADSLVSTSSRPLALRKRPDLGVSRQHYQCGSYWVIKDPIGLNYFRFRDEEYFLLAKLDGKVSLDALQVAWEARFAPRKIKPEQINQFLGSLHKSGLVVSDAPGQGRQLCKRRGERRREMLTHKCMNLLSLRFKGINPDRLLGWLEPKLRFMYSPWVVAACLLLALSAGLLVTVQFAEVRARMPVFHEFFTLANALWFMLAVGVVKVLHEFGHGVTCKHFGGECHEMGLMLLVLTPCLYANVSDSWMLPSKWQRALVGAAGIYVELIIASIATWVWWYSEPGLLSNLCLSTMMVCSVGTVMFNGNPLVRYDGYYILADLVEIPNLAQKSSTLLRHAAGKYLLGMDLPDDPFLPQRSKALFVAYALASISYRWLIVGTIFLFLIKLLAPYQLQVIGRLLGAISLFGVVVYPLWRLGKFFAVPGRIEQVKGKRMVASALGFSLLGAAVFFIPLPHRVYGPLETESHGAAWVYCDLPGLVQHVYSRPGDRVAAGQKLAQLENVDAQIDLERLLGRRDQLQARLTALRFRRLSDEAAAQEVPEAMKLLASLDEQIAEKREQLARLTLVAPVAGTVLPPPEVPRQEGTEELPGWFGDPFAARNQGALLKPQELFCQVGDPLAAQAVVVIDQADMTFLEPGQTVELELTAFPGKRFTGKIAEISSDVVTASPRHLTNKAGGALATKTDADGRERPLATSYQVHVYPIEGVEMPLPSGLRGTAKIHVAWQPLGPRVWRWFKHTFRLAVSDVG